LQCLTHQRICRQVHDVVAQRASEQELHRHVVNALGKRGLAHPSGLDPAVCDQVADEAAGGLELLSRGGCRGVHDVLA
jgi:hypothetical protein